MPPYVRSLCLAAACAISFPPSASAQNIDRAYAEEHYTKHEFRIPMRDGVRLFTSVYAPKDIATNYPIWLMRTPYGVRPYGVDARIEPNGHFRFYGREKFIFAYQDVRGRNGSEGEFVHARPIKAVKSGPKDYDESTDAWDTIEWLVKHVPANNGRVGLSGISYPGFYAASGAINGHPALKAVSPQAPIADWFIGDDVHHNGALYLPHTFNFMASFEQKLEKPTRENPKPFDYETPDGYEFYLNMGPLLNADAKYFKGKIPFWTEMTSHPDYDEYWQSRNLRPHLKNIKTAMLTVGGWYDAEDLFGALKVYEHTEKQNAGITNLLVMGPWYHGGWHRDGGEKFGNLNFRAKTAEYFQQHIELPFFKHFLKGGDFKLPEAFIFETGTMQWRKYDVWPPTQSTARTFYLRAGGKLSPEHPAEGDGAHDEYVSDPAKPVPFIPNTAIRMTLEHMVDDQRFAASRPDVLVYQTDPLEEDLTIAGPITASLQVSTTGTDSDWIVKLIDVYPGDFPNPDPNPANVQMGGYQQLVRGEPMRGKYRNSYEKPEPFTPGKVTKVEWVMPDACHTFRRGHRLMIHVQSSWFPLVDRNPQTFCNIYQAKAEDFRKSTQRVHRSAVAASSIQMRVIPTLPGK